MNTHAFTRMADNGDDSKSGNVCIGEVHCCTRTERVTCLRFHAFTAHRALPLLCTASFTQNAGGRADVPETSRLCRGASMQATGARVGHAATERRRCVCAGVGARRGSGDAGVGARRGTSAMAPASRRTGKTCPEFSLVSKIPKPTTRPVAQLEKRRP